MFAVVVQSSTGSVTTANMTDALFSGYICPFTELGTFDRNYTLYVNHNFVTLLYLRRPLSLSCATYSRKTLLSRPLFSPRYARMSGLASATSTC
jgi:hypothetical protein